MAGHCATGCHALQSSRRSGDAVVVPNMTISVSSRNDVVTLSRTCSTKLVVISPVVSAWKSKIYQVSFGAPQLFHLLRFFVFVFVFNVFLFSLLILSFVLLLRVFFLFFLLLLLLLLLLPRKKIFVTQVTLLYIACYVAGVIRLSLSSVVYDLCICVFYTSIFF